ncbi:hypothetical protein HYH03_004532 [Edaphochlamys debaryana]|uniref:Uncharacterized protein n=1 Tax=Edaphochlamys debaryana TaxID=47281 RepID=A0A835YGV7_9CHLO|nr:hypothetical protein HYH03_004532 [Edaphochlamys debaryana]|eukprot:KAG2497374.1 hypothetical protein HYH03_004532 [Edaphochlamys debaryana]
MGLSCGLVAALLLACAAPALSARKAFLGDLEKSSVEPSHEGGRRQLLNDWEILGSADYDVIEIESAEWMPELGAYGGYGIYGYYGGFYGVYGVLDGQPFLDYDVTLYDDLITAEVTKEEYESGGDMELPGRRRSLLMDSMDTGIGPAKKVGDEEWELPWSIDEEAEDYEFALEMDGKYGFYVGHGYGMYYGTVGYYGGYGGEFEPSIDELWEMYEKTEELTREVAEVEAAEDLEEAKADGEIYWTKP